MSYEQALQLAGAEVLAFENFGSYQGDWWAKVKINDKEAWVSGSFGSCSGCDAFEAEFGYGDKNCEDHRYDEEGAKGCKKCEAAKEKYVEQLTAFGAVYLDDLKTQEEAEKEASKNLEWDSDAQGMLDWIKANALGGA
jgi:hypothetical protein